MSHPVTDAISRLVEAGYFVANEAGWHRAVKPPTKADLAWYVKAVKTLGSWSVECGGSHPCVRLSTGGNIDEVLFKVER